MYYDTRENVPIRAVTKAQCTELLTLFHRLLKDNLFSRIFFHLDGYLYRSAVLRFNNVES